MSSRLLSLAAGTILEASPPDSILAAAEAGFPAVGIWFDADTWSPAVEAEIRRRLDATGLVALDIEPIMLSADGDHGERIVQAAKAVGARNILVASRDSDHQRVADRLSRLADLVDDAPIRLCLEFLPALGVRSLSEALAIVRQVNCPTLGVLVDSIHLSRSGGEPSDLVGVEPHLLPYLQLCDALPQPVDSSRAGLLDEALNGRLLPGEGALPLSELLAAVPNVALSIELRSAALREAFPDVIDRAKAVWRASQPYASL